MMFKRLFALCVMFAVVLPLAAPAWAQNAQPRRSLFEVLFGGGEQQQTQQQPQRPQTTTQPRQQPQPQRAPAPAPAPSASLPPPPPAVEKAEDAKRIMVFGDSLAVDLSRSMERFYADDDATLVIGRGVSSSGFVRNDYFDWNRSLDEALAADSFDIAVVIIGINDRQAIGSAAPLSDAWKAAYSARLEQFLAALRARGKPVIWVELPPMEQPRYAADMVQISSLHRQAVFAAGGEWVETYERYMGESGGYAANGPDLNGQIVSMRKSDGIHFSAAGSDKLSFYIDRAIRLHHAGGGSTVEVADLLAGTDAAEMLRPPFQGLGQMRLVEMAGIIQQLGVSSQRAGELVVAGAPRPNGGFDLTSMLGAPVGRVDAFGVGIAPDTDEAARPRGR